MQKKEVLIIGTDLAGCAVGLALAKKGIPVAIIPSCLSQKDEPMPLANTLSLEKLEDLQAKFVLQGGCCESFEGNVQAQDHLLEAGMTALQEILEGEQASRHSHDSLVEYMRGQLFCHPHVEWLLDFSAVELITLEHHSLRRSDRFKKPTCMGAYALNAQTQKIEVIFAKETILTIGGVGGLFKHTVEHSYYCGDGMAMASRAGARLIDMGALQTTPISLYMPGAPCIPVSSQILKAGATLLDYQKRKLDQTPIGKTAATDLELTDLIYKEMLFGQAEHIWLDLSECNEQDLKKYPLIQCFCDKYGMDSQGLLPVLPAVLPLKGGVWIDKTCQSSVQRLRALGEAACTGVSFESEAFYILETIAFAAACAEDINKQINKYIYYFGDVYEWGGIEYDIDTVAIRQDAVLLSEILWHNVAMTSNLKRYECAFGMLFELEERVSLQWHKNRKYAPPLARLRNAVQTAFLITKEAIANARELLRDDCLIKD